MRERHHTDISEYVVSGEIRQTLCRCLSSMQAATTVADERGVLGLLLVSKPCEGSCFKQQITRSRYIATFRFGASPCFGPGVAGRPSKGIWDFKKSEASGGIGGTMKV